MANLITYPDTPRTTLVFDYADKVDADSITMTIVEKGLTVTLYWSSVQYVADVTAFNSSDVGKTFTIVFDPEPTGYA